MSEEINNNIVNNETNSNNNYEPPKSNNGVKVLLVVLIILVLCLIGLTTYKMLLFDKKNDNKHSNNAIEKNDNKKDNKEENLEENNNIVENNKDNVNGKEENSSEKYNILEERVVKKGTFKNGKDIYEIRKILKNDADQKLENDVLYINNKKIDETANPYSAYKYFEFKDFVVVSQLGPGMSSDVYLVDHNGSVLSLVDIDKNQLKYVDLPSSLDNIYDGYKLWNSFSVDSIKNGKLLINVNRQYGNGWIDWYCHLPDKNEIASYSVQYEYVGNEKFNGKIYDVKTLADKYGNEDCSSVPSDEMVKKDN